MIGDVFRKKFLLETLIVSIVILVLHLMALSMALYWSVSWFDILMHFLGGLVIGLLSLYIFFTSGIFQFTQHIKQPALMFALVFMMVLVVGLSWELWELFVGFSDRLDDRFDTIIDIIMDSIGAIVAFWYGNRELHG